MKISILQTDILWGEVEKNLERAINLVEREASDSDLIILPEMAFTGFNIRSHEVAVAPNGGVAADYLRQYSKKSGKAFIFSSAVKDGDDYFNRLFAIMPDGREVTYDKRHLFRMGGEHKYYTAGKERVTIDYMGVRILPLVCYDLRFPVYSRYRDDYDLMIYIAEWPEARRYQWSTLLKGRAIENRAYVVGCNRCGSDPKLNYSGDSALIDYLGMPVVEAQPYKEQVLTAEIDIDGLNRFRANFPADMDADEFTLTL